MKQVTKQKLSNKLFLLFFFLALIDICISHEQSYSYVKYVSVFFHVYHIEKILEKLKDNEQFDNSSFNAHVRLY